ncbi:MAG: phage holin family protein [Corynebacterium sp.]|uniref:phage holin family protein n=1 Tax=unclassified Corynebacterium TaxID=2624378 RepID=UPI00264928D9|nr:phage holin family protein [Corynebacterium sp.]MDN5583134.1 phage holin family protein [Corynebacterium sp.]MDN5720340.1 phage holin family protein [Corynebacterium sp.]MDN6324314.1 phage holin family protein [Corynebacterium sp.]
MSDKNSNGLFTDQDSFNPKVNSIPLSDADAQAAGRGGSIADLVKDATAQVSSLIRSEVELAKTEISASAKKAGIAVAMFGAAGVVLAYSSFFFFFFLAELLDNWLPRWSAFLIVFGIMVVLVALLALLGVKFVKGVKKPQATIDSVNELKSVVPSGQKNESADNGLYT